MPTEQPSNQQNDDAPVPRDGESAAAVLSDDRMNDAPGGGGLMGAGAGSPEAGSAQGKAGAATPNSPIDARLPAGTDGDDGLAEAEARTRSLGDEPNERGSA